VKDIVWSHILAGGERPDGGRGASDVAASASDPTAPWQIRNFTRFVSNPVASLTVSDHYPR
jgi:hypothetical protein